MKPLTELFAKTRSVLPVCLLALGLATGIGAQDADAASAYATTSVDADQAALVFDAVFSQQAKTNRTASASSRAYIAKPWANTVDRNFYGR